MNKLILAVTKREVFGKKLKKIRKQGMLPANIFGPDFKSTAVNVDLKDFIKMNKTAGETAVVYLDLDKKEIPVLIKFIQKHPVDDNLLHVDFRKIDLAKKVVTEVPVKTTGTSIAITEKGGVLLIQSDVLEVEALPTDIPKTIEVDLSTITEIGGEIKVGNLTKSSKFDIKTPVEKVVVSVIAHKEESITPDTTAAPTEVIAEAEEGKVAEETAAPGTQAEKAPPVEEKPPAPKK